MDRRALKLSKFALFAQDLASLSTCVRLQVGAIVVDPDFREIKAIGYNGPPARFPNDSCTGVQGSCGCVHAEANAIIKLGSRKGLTLVTTTAPCPSCAGLIINCDKIASVLYIGEYRLSEGLQRLSDSGIHHDRIAERYTSS